MKILISVLSAEFEPYITLENSIRNTWFSNNHPNVSIIFYYGNHSKTHMMGDKLFIDSDEGLMNIGHKTIKMFEFVLQNYDFDFLFRTNSSSYVDTDKLCEFLSDKPTHNFYSAIVGLYNGIYFGSGSGYVLSKDLLKLVVEKKEFWDHTLIDDVSLGKILLENHVPIYPGLRFDVTRNNIYNIDKSHYHYRVKQENDRNYDVEIMETIHRLKKKITQ